ncbi:hypothetical protein [Geofilum rubicundum]|nr:hypothetical protein [Geofilum rubicundum]
MDGLFSFPFRFHRETSLWRYSGTEGDISRETFVLTTRYAFIHGVVSAL